MGDLNKPSVRILYDQGMKANNTANVRADRRTKREIERGQMIDRAMERERQRVARKNAPAVERKPVKETKPITYKEVRFGRKTATQETKSRLRKK